MKYFYLLITLLTLAACGPSEEEPASEPVPDPVNVFEGAYQGEVFGFDTPVSVEGDLISFDGDEPCVIEDPFSTTSVYVCISDDGTEDRATVKVEGDTLTVTPEGFDMEIVFERVSE
ncbi:MAG: hypothetical protein CBE49_001885 [Rickettsiales bacterium TMED289]|nr:hypothetical protein [Gammaproteobacteria bacterium]RPF74461.1 MAG: hypothetical protein CBE49_001885 [Rickettsiales bacterium TMED289]|tara:strand:- start:26815 stop:27165 length:351 start_codon:yes stop_codon:yes gene_type:complete